MIFYGYFIHTVFLVCVHKSEKNMQMYQTRSSQVDGLCLVAEMLYQV
jgi:hypothetical protein